MKKVCVDKNACITCGFCYSNASDIFACDDDATSKVIKEFVDDDDANAVMAKDSCPTGAISLEDVSEDEEDSDKKECNCGEACECEHCECHHE